ncbi:MAG: CvpA family protein [Ignavibacteriales bacterium]|nr:CvpA family protein [Ignavibacteriales bacterium]
MLDIILASFLLLGFLLGLKDGLLKKVFTLIAVLLGAYLSYRFFRMGSVFLMNNASFSPQLSVALSFLLIFLIVYIVVKVLYRLFEPDKPKYSIINRILGGIVGIVQAVIVLSFLLLGASFFHFPNEEMKEPSKLYKTLINLAPQIMDKTEDIFPRSTQESLQDSLQEIPE